MPLPDTNTEPEQEDEGDVNFGIDGTDVDFDRIQCCFLVNDFVKKKLAGEFDEKTLKQGHAPKFLRIYRGMIIEKINAYNGNMGSPQTPPNKKEIYEKKVKVLEFLRDTINMILKDSETPDDIKDVKTHI